MTPNSHRLMPGENTNRPPSRPPTRRKNIIIILKSSAGEKTNYHISVRFTPEGVRDSSYLCISY